jgi:hypothetical protein
MLKLKCPLKIIMGKPEANEPGATSIGRNHFLYTPLEEREWMLWNTQGSCSTLTCPAQLER